MQNHRINILDNISYSSGNEKVATVDEWGNIYAVGVGTTTITISSSGNRRTVDVTVSEVPAPVTRSSNSYTVYITDTGSKYHRAGCQYLKNSSHAVSLDDALAWGYTACKKCRP